MIDKPNYTQVPNLLLDDLMAYMGEAELKVTLAIARQTFGYHREQIKLSLSALQELTGMSRPSIVKGITEGMHRGTIQRQDSGDGYIYALMINDAALASKKSLLVKNVDQSGKDSLLEVVKNVDQNTPVLKKVVKKDLKKEGGRARATVPSLREPASKTMRVTSPHLDPRHFAQGYVPQGTGANPVEVYYERFSINQDAARLNAIAEDDITRLCPDLDKLREVIVAYSRTPFRPGNMQLILDWYRDGIPEKHRGAPANGLPKTISLSDAEKSKIVTRARNAQGNIKTAQQFKGNIDPAWQEAIDTAKGFGLI